MWLLPKSASRCWHYTIINLVLIAFLSLALSSLYKQFLFIQLSNPWFVGGVKFCVETSSVNLTSSCRFEHYGELFWQLIGLNRRQDVSDDKLLEFVKLPDCVLC